MNRHLWQQNITLTYCPPWPCPICNEGTLALTKDSVQSKEGVRSQRARNHDDWDPDWIEYSFTAWAQCTHSSCQQNFAIAGRGGITQMEVDGLDGPDFDWLDVFEPLVCHPMPDIFVLPPKCSTEIAQELRGAFFLYWSQTAASANRLRVALELLLNHAGVQKTKKANNGQVNLSLHARLDIYAQKEQVVGSQLMALKWLGNSGSHGGGVVSREDLLDAFEIMEHALLEIIEKRSKYVATLAKNLTKKHSKKKKK